MKMTTRLAICSLWAVALGLILTAATSAALIDDNLNADTSANYTKVIHANAGGADDTVVTWAFDYSTLGIPSAPNSGDTSTIGVHIVANQLGLNPGAPFSNSSAATLFHNTPVSANARITVDMYMGYTGTGGTTEFGSVGIGSTGNTPFTIFNPIAGDGTYMTHTGDGGSSSDWRWSRPGGTNPAASVPVNATPFDDGNGFVEQQSYLLGGTNAPLYDGVNGLVEDPLHPGTPVGNGGNQWITFSIAVNNGVTKIFANGQKIIEGSSVGDADSTNRGGNAPGGLAGFSYADVFSSVASPGNSQFGVFDNLKVEVIPEPSSMLLLGLGMFGLGAVSRKRH